MAGSFRSPWMLTNGVDARTGPGSPAAPCMRIQRAHIAENTPKVINPSPAAPSSVRPKGWCDSSRSAPSSPMSERGRRWNAAATRSMPMTVKTIPRETIPTRPSPTAQRRSARLLRSSARSCSKL